MSTITNGQGVYEFTGLASGRYTLTVDKEAEFRQAKMKVSISTDQDKIQDVTLMRRGGIILLK